MKKPELIDRLTGERIAEDSPFYQLFVEDKAIDTITLTTCHPDHTLLQETLIPIFRNPDDTIGTIGFSRKSCRSAVATVTISSETPLVFGPKNGTRALHAHVTHRTNQIVPYGKDVTPYTFSVDLGHIQDDSIAAVTQDHALELLVRGAISELYVYCVEPIVIYKYSDAYLKLWREVEEER